MTTLLDWQQVVKEAFDDASSSLKTKLTNSLETAIEVSHLDGDTIETHAATITGTGSSTSTNIVGDELVTPIDSSGVHTALIYAKTTTNITGTPAIKLQASPTTSGDVWVDLDTLALDTTAPNVVKGTIANTASKRLRVIQSVVMAAGAATVYLVGVK